MDKGRLRWRARRGTRELDAMLGGWLDERFDHADEAQRQAFDELLDVQDPELWDWLMGHARPGRVDWQAIKTTERLPGHSKILAWNCFVASVFRS